MPRVKRGTTANKRRRKILRQAKGFRWGRKSKERLAREALMKAGVYAYRDRRVRKRDFRGLWQVRINAAARENNISYSRLMAALKKKNIAINRKALAEIAMRYPAVFKKLVETAGPGAAASNDVAPVPEDQQ